MKKYIEIILAVGALGFVGYLFYNRDPKPKESPVKTIAPAFPPIIIDTPKIKVRDYNYQIRILRDSINYFKNKKIRPETIIKTVQLAPVILTKSDTVIFNNQIIIHDTIIQIKYATKKEIRKAIRKSRG